MSQKRGVDAPAATGIITRLEQHGLVERRHDREDRRVVKVYLTDEEGGNNDRTPERLPICPAQGSQCVC